VNGRAQGEGAGAAAGSSVGTMTITAGNVSGDARGGDRDWLCGRRVECFGIGDHGLERERDSRPSTVEPLAITGGNVSPSRFKHGAWDGPPSVLDLAITDGNVTATSTASGPSSARRVFP
jgi:hypothetical protein